MLLYLMVLPTGITESTCGCITLTKKKNLKNEVAQLLWVGDTKILQMHVIHESK